MHKRRAQHALPSDLHFNVYMTSKSIYTTQPATQSSVGKVDTTAPGVTGEPGVDSPILASLLTMTVVHEGMSRLCYPGNKHEFGALVGPFIKGHQHIYGYCKTTYSFKLLDSGKLAGICRC